MRSVLVSGSGIAGLTTAYWLAKDGWKVTIVEKAKGERLDGYMMDFYGNGWDVAEKMGIEEKIRNIHYPIIDVQIVKNNGQKYFSFPVSRMIKALDNKYRPIRRPDLEHILLGEVKKFPVTILYDTVVKDLENTPALVKVKLSSGIQRSFDIVVGADGVHSNIRKLVFGQESLFSHYLGYIFSFFHTKRDKSIGDNLCLYQEPNRQFGMYPYSENEMDVLYVLKSKEHKRMQKSEYKPFLTKEIKGMGWIAEEILENTPSEKVTFLDTTEQIRMDSWYKNRVVLVGDAGACPTLAAGQGSSMAMTEAYVLTKNLREFEDIDKAFKGYQEELSDYVSKIQIKGAKFAKSFIPSSTLGVIFQRWFMMVAMSPLFARKSLNWFTEKKIL